MPVCLASALGGIFRVNSTQWLWRTIAVCAVVSTALCVFGFIYAVNHILFPTPVVPSDQEAAPAEQKNPDPLTDKDRIRIVALGDSLTAGTGDLTGKGYVGQVRDKLEKQTGRPVFVHNNFAIPGYRTQDLLKDFGAKKDIAQALSEADVIMISIGGNDLFQGGEGIFDQPGKEFNPQAAAERMPDALKRLDQILSFVGKQNSKALIYYIGLYHPFLDLDTAREGSLLIQKWNSAAFEITNKYSNMVLVPTYDLFELNANKYLYSDHFHPNQDGYERIAERIVQIMK
jgi:lysophospholipase L1-like esterase